MFFYVCLICREPQPEMTPEERDVRTVFCMQLAARIRPKDLEEFFSSVGKVCPLGLRRSRLINGLLSFPSTGSIFMSLSLSMLPV